MERCFGINGIVPFVGGYTETSFHRSNHSTPSKNTRKMNGCRECRGTIATENVGHGGLRLLSTERLKERYMSRKKRADPPTPDEIRERCEQIQREWSEAERHRRTRIDCRPTVPVQIPRTRLRE